jgi:hypothetical protein
MDWWDILKSANVAPKTSSKGSSFDASKIKINIKDDESCVEKFNKIYKYINDEFMRIKNSTSLESDTNGIHDGNAWVWFAFSEKDIRDASSGNHDTEKILAEMEYINYEAKDEKLACKQLKTLAEYKLRIKNMSEGDEEVWPIFNLHINTYDFEYGETGGTLQMTFSVIDPNKHKHYRRKIQMKPSLKLEFVKLADSMNKLFKTTIQMAKDAVREKGL